MKTIFRALMLGTMLTATGAVSVLAQDVCTEVEAKQALYKQFTDNIPAKNVTKTLDEQKVAVQAGKQYVEKYGACADDKQIVDYLKTNVPAMEKYITVTEGDIIKQKRYTDFNTAVGASKTADILSTGKAILAVEPDFLDVTIALASAGFDQSVANPPVDTFNNDTITYSKMAIQQIEANKPSSTGDYGVKQYVYKSDKYKDGKSNVLGLMNYNIGYILYYRQGKDNPAKKKEALPYFYKATQYNSFSKTNPFVYQTIGAWYLDEAIRIDTERQAALKANGDKDNDATLAMLGTQKGYAERAIDAYARAYSYAKADQKNAAYATDLYTKLKQLYSFRFNKADGMDAYIASATSKPLPDPMTEVTPVKEDPATTTTTGTTKSTALASDNTSTSTASTSGMAKPTGSKTGGVGGNATTTTVKPAATTTKTPAKKPTPKKKGTR